MIIKIPSYFQPFTDWKTELNVEGATVGEVLEDLFRQFPQLRQHFYTHWGILSANVLIYLNQEEIFTLAGLNTPVNSTDRITIVPTASGG
jgi:molybdopterin converting factor small subunit